MPGILGKKLGMTNIYNDAGDSTPVTAIQAGPCPIVAIKTKEKDGYTAIQIGYGKKSKKGVNKPETGHFAKAGIEPTRVLKEFRNVDISDYKVGDNVTVEILKVGDKVDVVGKSKGKGFQGVIKRHGFSGVGGRTHGQGDRERAPGSIGQSSDPSRVLKGMKMGGRTGGKQITSPKLKVIKILPEENVVFVKGAVPGAINSIVEINK
ncbi:MAG: 50S ribosomal protein L3 [Melioribacteraceae bacterium]|nr:50S ribosomal protein L3 [Melioribacteraceae bacterium]MCF8264243.1 50S ribosomal protein L3 [Melioribacteraceae bacterium]MCF8414429.1 50S ribosomal protein L3 [Melioribacteraceae bacterium]